MNDGSNQMDTQAWVWFILFSVFSVIYAILFPFFMYEIKQNPSFFENDDET